MAMKWSEGAGRDELRRDARCEQATGARAQQVGGGSMGGHAQKVGRRYALKVMATSALGLAAAPMINLRRYQLFGQSMQEYSARAVELVGRSLVIDMVSFLTYNPQTFRTWIGRPDSFTEKEWEPFRTSGNNVFCHSVGLPSYEAGIEWFAKLNGFLASRHRFFTRIDSGRDLETVKESGKLGMLLGLQNSDHFRTPDDVKAFHGLGQRVSQLTYNEQNRIGSGSTERVDGGLSDFGVSVIERMNGVGMAIDVSHCGDRTTLDSFEMSKKPVLITHANCRALVEHPRCKQDEAIREMAKSGGVMGITNLRNFVRDREPTTIEHVLDHYDHVAKLVGVEHVGVGSDADLDGYDDLPPEVLARAKSRFKKSYGFREKADIEGLDHPMRIYDLTEGLIRRGYRDHDIELILGGNFKRALSGIWSV